MGQKRGHLIGWLYRGDPVLVDNEILATWAREICENQYGELECQD